MSSPVSAPTRPPRPGLRLLFEHRGGQVGQYPVMNFQYRIICRLDSLVGRIAVQNRSFRGRRHRRHPVRHRRCARRATTNCGVSTPSSPTRSSTCVRQRISARDAGQGAPIGAQGMAGGKVIIGFDARHNSVVFARDTAEIMSGAGFQTMITSGPLPTPVVAFGIRHLGCVAGVVVTASHNPPQDNGYKVYLGDGSQIAPPADAQISSRIDEVATHSFGRRTALSVLCSPRRAVGGCVSGSRRSPGTTRCGARTRLGLHPTARRGWILGGTGQCGLSVSCSPRRRRTGQSGSGVSDADVPESSRNPEPSTLLWHRHARSAPIW